LLEAGIRATENNQALPPTQTGARVYCQHRGFTSEKTAKKCDGAGSFQHILIVRLLRGASLKL